jgi:hypothetical protein
MRMRVRLPQIEMEGECLPTGCPYCRGQQYKAHGRKPEVKAVQDPDYEQVSSLPRMLVSNSNAFIRLSNFGSLGGAVLYWGTWVVMDSGRKGHHRVTMPLGIGCV